MNPSSLMSLSSRVVLRHVYYVDELNQTIVNHSGLIPIEDIKKLQRSKYLSEECGDEYFMKYLFDNPIRGVFYAARYGILPLFEMFKSAPSEQSCWREAPHKYRNLSLSAAAAIGGNIKIVKQVVQHKQVQNRDYEEMMMYAVMYGRIDVVEYCFEKKTFTNRYLICLVDEALDKNVSTKMLITLMFHTVELRTCQHRYGHDNGLFSVYIKLLIELGFHRVINYHEMLFPDDFAKVDLSCNDLCENNENNKLFIYALYNNVFINHTENLFMSDFEYAFVAVCISKKTSIELFNKLWFRLLKFKPIQLIYTMFARAIEHIIDSMSMNKRMM